MRILSNSFAHLEQFPEDLVKRSVLETINKSFFIKHFLDHNEQLLNSGFRN